ncbi:MAG TPA: hypothetical protein VKV05_08465 [Terriglobales bacterium]|nr:hypothetical protein [Terriglobales bacterium]
MQRKSVVLVVVCFMSCATLLYAGEPKNATFHGTKEQVFNAAVRAAQSFGMVRFTDRESGTITFDTVETAMWASRRCSAVVDDLGSDGVRVSLKIEGAFRSGKIAEQFFKGIQDELAKQTKDSR